MGVEFEDEFIRRLFLSLQDNWDVLQLRRQLQPLRLLARHGFLFKISFVAGRDRWLDVELLAADSVQRLHPPLREISNDALFWSRPFLAGMLACRESTSYNTVRVCKR